MSGSWNAELVRATEARVCYHVSIGSSKEFMWRKAHAAILAVEKDIRRQPSGRIVNMPRLKEITTQQELEAIIRGEQLVVPPEMLQAVETPPESDFARHPYLRRMEYRGGGFAILMAFCSRLQQPGARQYMFKSEVLRDAQPYCDISMTSSSWARASVGGWSSHRSLLSHRLIVASRGPTQREEFRLTADGQQFLDAMLRKWPTVPAEACGGAAPDPCVGLANDPASEVGSESVAVVASPELTPAVMPPSSVKNEEVVVPQAIAVRMPNDRDDAPERCSSSSSTCAPLLAERMRHRRLCAAPTPSRKRPAPADLDEDRAQPDRFFQSSSGPPGIALARDEAQPETLAQHCPVMTCCPIAVLDAFPMAASGFSDIVFNISSDAETVIDPSTEEEEEEADGQNEEGMQRASPNGSNFHEGEIDFPGKRPSPFADLAPAGPPVVEILVDDRERLRDIDPRGVLDRVRTAIDILKSDGIHGAASRRRLRFGDFVWLGGSLLRSGIVGAIAVRQAPGLVLGCIVERKRIADLVGRSASGAHVKQLERLESCGLPHPFLLIEGDPQHARDCPVFDRNSKDDSEALFHDAIACKEDILDLCARLFVLRSKVGVITTWDPEGTARLLGHLTAWLAHDESRSSTCRRRYSLAQFEEIASEQASARQELQTRLLTNNVPPVAAEALRRRFASIQDARSAILSSDSLEQRCHVFAFLPGCNGVGERICSALGIPVNPIASCSQMRRSVHILASPAMIRRLRRSKPASEDGELPEDVILEEASDLWNDLHGSSCAEIFVVADTPPHSSRRSQSSVRRRSAKLFVAVVPGGWFVSEVLRVASFLGAGASSPAIAEVAANSFSSQLPKRCSETGEARLVVVEGLRAAVLAEARLDRRKDSSDDIDGSQAAGHLARAALLPKLLCIAELAALALDLREGWRTRIHEFRPAEATSGFIQALARVALEEAATIEVVAAP